MNYAMYGISGMIKMNILEKEIGMQYFIKSAQLGNVDVQDWLKSEGHSY